jgi:hypothetical protein
MKNKLHLYPGNLRESGGYFSLVFVLPAAFGALDAGGSMDFAIYKKI